MSKRNAGLVLLACAWLPLLGSGAADDLPRGTPVETVACAADPSQNYALYLPAAYSGDRRWPIIYCFDPGARGSIPIRLFRAAAEAFGYIVVCSNNSQNGPWEPIARAARAVWRDTRERFAIDDARVYSAGHSGGAKAALMFGLFLGRPWAGVISCCGGWPQGLLGETLPKDLAVFVTAGLYDFNYGPSRDIASRLDALGMAERLEIFPDGHTWLPGDVAMDAVAWLELQAMKKGRRKQDDGWIASRFEAQLGRAREIEKGGNPFAAYEACLALAADFRGLIDVAPAESSAARLARQVNVEKFFAARQAAQKEENRKFARADRALNAFMSAGNARERHRWLGELGIPGLRREKGDDTAAGLSAERVLRFLFMEAANHAGQAYGQGDMKKAMALYELTVLIDPGRGIAWFNLACAYSRLGEIRKALRALEAAVRNGVRDREVIATDPDLEAIRGEPAYVKLLETLRRDPPARTP